MVRPVNGAPAASDEPADTAARAATRGGELGHTWWLRPSNTGRTPASASPAARRAPPRPPPPRPQRAPPPGRVRGRESGPRAQHLPAHAGQDMPQRRAEDALEV